MIGIFTIHTGYNEGAVLQSLALSRLLSALSGEAVEVLDHRSRRRWTDRGSGDTPRKQAIATSATQAAAQPASASRTITAPPGPTPPSATARSWSAATKSGR